MRLENFLALTKASLIGEPCVHNFENIVFEAHKVKRGDLFFAYNHDEIELAVANGAYGIVFDKPTQISDGEIAWIKVKNLDDALKKIVRYKTIEKEMTAYESSEIILKLSMQIASGSNFLTLRGDLRTIFKTIYSSEEKTTLLFCPALVDREMFGVVKKMPPPPYSTIQVMEQTLFETSFIYDDIFFERELISPFFIPYLQELLHLYKTLKIDYRLKKFTPIEHFEAVFINKKFEIKSFGSSDMVLIFEPNLSLIEPEIGFLEHNAPWAKTIFIVPSHLDNLKAKNIFRYTDEKEIPDILGNNHFNFAFIAGLDKSILKQMPSNQMQLTMDF